MKSLYIIIAVCYTASLFTSCKDQTKKTSTNESIAKTETESDYQLSLAQWSFHKALQSGEMTHLEFIKKAAALEFTGVEYVCGFFKDKATDIQFLDSMNLIAEENNIQQLLIMVDEEGDLASPKLSERIKAIDKHKKWIDAAKYLGCHSIRVNLFGEMYDLEKWKTYGTHGLKGLAEYAQSKDINVIVENHGWLSSNAEALMQVITKVNLPNCGTLPDFGNFCLERSEGKLWGGECLKSYDKYQGVDEMMPFAKAVSAKSYHFDPIGYETTIDFKKMMDIVKKHKYQGFIGVEYEGNELTEKDGIIATRDLLKRYF